MSQILPESTALPVIPIPRSHAPEKANWKGGYREYRDCFRWDFGFTCLFCLRHETDIVPSGAEGWGVTSAEHVSLQSEDPSEANDYENVVYACKRCNRDRGKKPLVDGNGRRLLDPTKTAWSARFALDGEVISPNSGDTGAEYTEEAYDMNAEKKGDARRLRAEKIRETLDRLSRDRQRETKLVELASTESDPDRRQVLVEVARGLRRDRKEIIADFVGTYRAVPVDAPRSCRCKSPPAYQLPAWLAVQCHVPPNA